MIFTVPSGQLDFCYRGQLSDPAHSSKVAYATELPLFRSVWRKLSTAICHIIGHFIGGLLSTALSMGTMAVTVGAIREKGHSWKKWRIGWEKEMTGKLWKKISQRNRIVGPMHIQLGMKIFFAMHNLGEQYILCSCNRRWNMLLLSLLHRKNNVPTISKFVPDLAVFYQNWPACPYICYKLHLFNFYLK